MFLFQLNALLVTNNGYYASVNNLLLRSKIVIRVLYAHRLVHILTGKKRKLTALIFFDISQRRFTFPNYSFDIMVPNLLSSIYTLIIQKLRYNLNEGNYFDFNSYKFLIHVFFFSSV